MGARFLVNGKTVEIDEAAIDQIAREALAACDGHPPRRSPLVAWLNLMHPELVNGATELIIGRVFRLAALPVKAPKHEPEGIQRPQVNAPIVAPEPSTQGTVEGIREHRSLLTKKERQQVIAEAVVALKENPTLTCSQGFRLFLDKWGPRLHLEAYRITYWNKARKHLGLFGQVPGAVSRPANKSSVVKREPPAVALAPTTSVTPASAPVIPTPPAAPIVSCGRVEVQTALGSFVARENADGTWGFVLERRGLEPATMRYYERDAMHLLFTEQPKVGMA